MSVSNFIEAMPKVDLGLQLEGTIPKQTLMRFVDRNEKRTEKGFNAILEQYHSPDPATNVWDVLVKVNQAIMYPDDLTRAVYDTGVVLSKQNIRYAEIGVNPLTYMNSGMTFEQFADALSDGTDRAHRGWNIDIGWILTIPYDEPRRGDEIARWAATAGAKKAGVIGLGLVGLENKQPAAQFERPFRNAEKRDLGRMVSAGDVSGLEAITDALSNLSVDRIVGAWGLADSDEVLKQVRDESVSLCLLLTREKFAGRVEALVDYPLAKLREAGVDYSFSAGLPEVYNTTTSRELQAAFDASLVTIEDLEESTLKAVQSSFMNDDNKTAMVKSFRMLFTALRQQHLVADE